MDGSAAAAPLLSRAEEDEPPTEHDEAVLGHDGSSAVTGKGASGRVSLFTWLLVLSACVSGLLFGYDTGVISATLVTVGSSLSGRQLSSLDKSVITSCASLLALVASPLASICADAIGRRKVILAADVLFVVGAVVQAVSSTVGGMVLGRSVVGAAIGAASFVTPLYISELSPAAFRGRLVTMNVLSITFGQVVAYVVGWALAEHGEAGTAWRWMVGLGAVPAVVQCFAVLFMPDTPRWLVKAGRSGEARRVISRTLGSEPTCHDEADGILKDIEKEVRAGDEVEKKWLDKLKELVSVPRNRRALTIACLLQGLQQLCGFNSLMYFSATIFSLLGFSAPTLASLSVALTNFVFTLTALILIDRVGRRRILLYSIPFMTVGLLVCSLGFASVRIPGAVAAESLFQDSAAAPMIILISMILYVAAYALGLGNVPWMQSELFGLEVRSLGSGLATATNWSANFVVGLTFLPLMDAITPSWTFIVYAFVCALGWLTIRQIYPETTGLSLEAATKLLENDWGIA